MELSFFVKGAAIGFSIAAPVGPIGILCIRRSLADGVWKGFSAGLGAADAAYGQATARSARVATVLMTQNLDSLQSQIGKMETEALLGNFNTKIFCANDHVASNEWAAKT